MENYFIGGANGPTAIFLLCGITLGHILLIVFAVIFGIAHVYVTTKNRLD